MSQEQLNNIVKILRNGAPALADELVNCIVNLLNENAKLRSEISKTENDKQEDTEKEDN